ncbi:conserved hypothetical protein [Talaromyces marneffei ATCC 18224]|uniref:Phospholipid scramblase n=1 Tax=Talaromyces marneffei (strain ATCC 18224 / CBS 334.59 / QM 7333) TaxID=441960 RepID=B6QIY5_TALMQ|nr:conserved hypothetical protein [Talaromyces marneffei ATCC 18224]
MADISSKKLEYTFPNSDTKTQHEQQQYEQHMEMSNPPPPAYSEQQQQQQAQFNNDATSKYPPQAHHIQYPTLTLQTENTKLLGTALRIYDLTNPSKDLFNVKVNAFSMNLHFFRPNDRKQEFASVKFHQFSMKMDVVLPDTPMFTIGVKMKRNYEMSYPSPALGGQMVTWKTSYHWKTIDFEYRDASGVMLARIKASNFKWKKMSQVEFFGDAATNQRLVEEVVVTGAAILEYVLVMNACTVAAS